MDKYFGSKQPTEQYYVQFDFANYLGSDTISVVVLVAAINFATSADATATVTDSTKQNNTTTAVNIFVRAGDSGSNYKLTCRVTTAGGSTYELDGILPVMAR